MSSDTTKKRKKYSKNKKRNWNKTDITDVEEFFEEKRIQERTGGLIEEKSDNQLFFVDTVTEEPAAKRKRKEAKHLKCHSSLEPAPGIRPIFVDKNNRNLNNEKKLSDRVLEKKKRGFVSKTEILAQKQSKEAKEKKRLQARATKNRIRTQADYDLWGGQQEEITPPDKKPKVKVPKNLRQKSSIVPAIEAAHPGQSYNPTFEDHQDLLSQANKVEVKKLKDDERVVRATDEYYKKAQGTSEERWNTEMSAGLFNEHSDSESDNDADPDKISINPPVDRSKKKSERQKRKDKKRKEKEQKLKRLKENKHLKNEIFRLKSIKKSVAQEEEEIKEREKKKLELQEKNKGATKKLGKLKFEAEEIPLKLSDELEGSLRLLKPEGNLVEERFKSFQKRNIIETRKRVKKERKYKPKTFEKKGHRAVTL